MNRAYHRLALGSQFGRDREPLPSSKPLLLSLIYALIFAGVLTSLPLAEFRDRTNYLTYAAQSETIFARNVERGFLAVIFNEPLWIKTNIWLSNFFELETTLRLIIFVPAFLVSFLIIYHNPRYAFWLSIFLLTPQVLKNHIIHLRQGMGIGVFLLGYFAGPKWMRIALITVAGFIHSSFLCIGLIILSVWVTGKLSLSPWLRIVILVACFIVLGVVFGAIAGGLGARQGEQYATATLDISGLGFVFWFCMLALFLSAGTGFIRQNLLPISVLGFYISVYFLTAVAGRIFESGLLLVLLGGLSIRGWKRQAFIAAYMLFASLIYLKNWGQPWFGWGV